MVKLVSIMRTFANILNGYHHNFVCIGKNSFLLFKAVVAVRSSAHFNESTAGQCLKSVFYLDYSSNELTHYIT